jgi:hypothetical protein
MNDEAGTRPIESPVPGEDPNNLDRFKLGADTAAFAAHTKALGMAMVEKGVGHFVVSRTGVRSDAGQRGRAACGPTLGGRRPAARLEPEASR